ncbi:MAG: SusD/RagB family nutrient-binding outer membrane lipoprotein [Bacteroidales bacterium]
MKKVLYTIIIMGALLFSTGCEKYLDINRNPNGPEKVTAYLYLGPMQQEFAAGIQWDARYVGFYNQYFAYYSANYAYDLQGTPAWVSDNGGQMWRSVYWKLGWNLTNMIQQSEDEKRWDIAGIGYTLRAWGWMLLTDHHGPIILKEAFTPGLYIFKYDNENVVYEEVLRLCDLAIENLNRTDGTVSAAFAGKGDQIYGGNRIRWKRLAYGVKAITLSHLSNKSTLYDPNAIIACVDSSFTANTDNALIGFGGTVSTDANFFGPMRNNFQYTLPSKYIVSLLNGTVLGTPDPRISIMIPPTPNIVNGVAGAQYTGVQPGFGYTPIATGDRPYSFYGLAAVGTPTSATTGMFLFKNNAKFPLMTYSELQFIKAEAAFRKGDKPTALTAYSAGVSAAIDFTNTYAGATTWGTVAQVSTAQKTAFLGGVVPAVANNLTLSMIMCQKYIHLYAWGFQECWTDIRRYHYTDTYAAEATQVFAGFTLPTLAAENNGKVIYRMRPRYNSEYVWNSAELDKVGGLALDYHTKIIWIAQPE